MLQLEAQLSDRDVTIELSEDAAKWLIKHGYDEQMGARPMARTIQETIKKPLADEVLFGKLKSGGHVRVIVVEDETGAKKLGFEYLERPGDAQAGKDPAAQRQAQAPRIAAAQQAHGRPQRRRRRQADPSRLGAEGAAGEGVGCCTAAA